MKKWYINYGTGAGNFVFEGTEDEAKAAADEGVAYTQQSVLLVAEDGEAYLRPWRSLPYDQNSEDCGDVSPDEIIDYGRYGYYDAWEDWSWAIDDEHLEFYKGAMVD